MSEKKSLNSIFRVKFSVYYVIFSNAMEYRIRKNLLYGHQRTRSVAHFFPRHIFPSFIASLSKIDKSLTGSEHTWAMDRKGQGVKMMGIFKLFSFFI